VPTHLGSHGKQKREFSHKEAQKAQNGSCRFLSFLCFFVAKKLLMQSRPAGLILRVD